ncbi:hypothetical protein BX616_007552, partial [Lobosporangium transversale]
QEQEQEQAEEIVSLEITATKQGTEDTKSVKQNPSETLQSDKQQNRLEEDQAADSGTEFMPRDDDNDDDNDDRGIQTDRLGNTIPKKPSQDKRTAEKEKIIQEEPNYIFRKAFKRYLISKLPPTLILHLKRFEQSGRFGQMRKIDDHVEIPVTLDMSPYFMPASEIEHEDEEDNQNPSKSNQYYYNGDLSKRYRLYGAVVHMGTLGGGHYINYVLSSKVVVPEDTKATEVVSSGKSLKSNNSRINTKVDGQELPDVSLAMLTAQQGKKRKNTKKSTIPTGATGNVSIPQDDVATSQDNIVAPQDNVTIPQDNVTIPQDNVETPQDNVETPQDNVETPQVNIIEQSKSEKEEDVVDTRQWIACSDTNVRMASLQEVLASRAYLLFYERY